MTTPGSSPVEPTHPNASRIYDYTLGGKLNHAVDRQAAEYMFSLVPSTRKWVIMLRAFLQQVARDLYEEGFTQFLDLGSGLPTQDHIHHVLPDATVIYMDLDPLTVEHGQQLLADKEKVHYLEGDLRNIEAVLRSDVVRERIDLTQKVALGLNAVLVFLTRDEVEDLSRALYDWAPAGSKIYVTLETKAIGKTTPEWEEFIRMFAVAGSPFYLVSLEENMEMLRPWRPIRIEPVADYLGHPPGYITEADREKVDLEFYSVLLQK